MLFAFDKIGEILLGPPISKTSDDGRHMAEARMADVKLAKLSQK